MWQNPAICGEICRNMWKNNVFLWRNSIVMKKLKRLNIRVPECLLEPIAQLVNVSYSILFALVFLTLWTPFSTTTWFHIGLPSDRFIWTIVFVGVSILFLACSRIILGVIYSKAKRFPIWGYITWLLSEVLLIGAFHAFLAFYMIKIEGYAFPFILFKSFLVTIIALGVPYLTTSLFIMLRATRRLLTLTSSDAVESDNEVLPEHAHIINIMDNNGNLKMSLKLENLFYIKSEDNYINVYYLKKGKVASYLLRCKLQTIENNCISDTIIRCHRSYIVNISNVSVLHNESDGFMLDFDYEELESVPVSKTYAARVMEAFSKR